MDNKSKILIIIFIIIIFVSIFLTYKRSFIDKNFIITEEEAEEEAEVGVEEDATEEISE
mgnify:CR=1 FL=1